MPDLSHGLMPGQVVTITENARPVAQIVPVPDFRTRPPHHKDPFDRLIAATALVEALTFFRTRG